MLSPVRADSPRFETLWKGDGLPGDTVWAIAQDQTGYIWIGTADGLARYDGYSLTTFTTASTQQAPISGNRIRALHVDADNRLWVGTDLRGLNRLTGERGFHAYRHDPNDLHTLSSDNVRAIDSDGQGNVWIGTDHGLNRLDPTTGKVDRFLHDPLVSNSLPDATVRSLLVSNSGLLWVGTYAGLALFDAATNSFNKIELSSDDSRIIALYEDDDGLIWIGTAAGLVTYDPRNQQVATPLAELTGRPVISITGNGQGLWFGTLKAGLYRLSAKGEVSTYRYHRGVNSIADDVVLTLLTDRGQTMWAGTFNNGLSKLDTRSLAFGLHDDVPSSIACLKSRVVYGVFPERNNVVWIGSGIGAVRYDRNTGQCTHFQSIPARADTLAADLVVSFTRTEKDFLWVSTGRGLNRLNEQSGAVDRLVGHTPAITTFFALAESSGKLLLGTNSGLYRYDVDQGASLPVDTLEPALADSSFHAFSQDPDGRYWFGTDQGIAYLDNDGRVSLLRSNGLPAVPHIVDSIYASGSEAIWAGVEDQGLWVLAPDGSILRKYSEKDGLPPGRLVGAILPDQHGNLWLSTLSGIAKIDHSGEVTQIYTEGDGLQSDSFVRGSAYVAANGELFFGGRRGLNAFFPDDLVDNPTPPPVVITELRLMNEVASADKEISGFRLPGPIESVQKLRLNHRHKALSLEFAGLDYADVDQNKYAYKLDGFDSEWNDVPAGQRRATYTNLNPGDYTFAVRAANKDGVWNDAGRVLQISIAPAPWVTWWAKTLYVLAGLAMLLALVRARTVAHRRRALELEQEVASRTREVEQQKSTIEQILARKNALFENVSHEFRTPLTLLMGPLVQLRSELDDPEQGQKLELALRNAKRLLLMVDQLLRLAELSQGQELQRAPREIAPVLHMLMASFSMAAKQNGVTLTMGTIPDVAALVSHDALETVVGNLLSNAIKYVGREGTVSVGARTVSGQVEITVADDGPGIEPKQLDRLFERFSRLPQHSTQPGTGLGLAVTKEVVEANQGSIEVVSEVGVGTTFTVRLPVSDSRADQFQPLDRRTEMLVSELESPLAQLKPGTDDNNEQIPLVLVIDDNLDVLSYVRSVLEAEFRVASAAGAIEGIETARRTVPDLIICDVMMPEMDGFEVSRRLRADPATSHIPVVMLTARGDRASRLRGWEEAVDEYLQKPFDEEELRVRIRNLLEIRRLLRVELGRRFDQEGRVETRQLNQRDQAFVAKLNQVTAENFSEPSFGRARLSSLMAISERQLQRKLKALLDRSPSTFLRNFRLREAKRRLDDGQQVTLVADECGFTSSSYFAKCFKEKYGLPPKQYQIQSETRS